MRRDFFRPTTLVVGAALAGWIGWSGEILLLPAAAAFPVLWAAARSRWQVSAISAAYFLTASRGLPQGVATYFSFDLWQGILLWLAAAVSFVCVHTVTWTMRNSWVKPTLYLSACIAMAVPPFGITGWAHPMTAAGVLLPGWKWWGFWAMAAGLAILTTRYWPAAAMAMTGLWLWSAAEWTTPILPASWQGVDLSMGASLGRNGSLARQNALIAIIRARPPGMAVVLPEGAIGYWTPTVQRAWMKGLAGSGLTVIAGAAVLDERGYDNVLVSVSAEGGAILYLQRMPVPGSMWQPWRGWFGEDGGARANLFTNPVVDVGGLKVAPLICYEQLLVWPALQAALYRPDIVVAVGNIWWAADTSIPDIQRASSGAWARLFDLPIVNSFNS